VAADQEGGVPFCCLSSMSYPGRPDGAAPPSPSAVFPVREHCICALFGYMLIRSRRRLLLWKPPA